MEKQNKIKDIILGMIVTVIVGYVGLRIFSIMMLLYPMAGIVLGSKYSIKDNVGIIMISNVIMTMLFGYQIIPFLIILTIIGIVINYGINKNEEPLIVIGKSTAFIFIIITIAMGIMKVQFEIDIVEMYIESMDTVVETTIEQAKELDYYKEEDLKEMEKTYKGIVELIRPSFPSLIIISIAVISALIYILSTYAIVKRKIKTVKELKISEYRVSGKFLFFMIVTLAVSLFIKSTDIQLYEILENNIMNISFALVYVQGLGVMVYSLRKFKISYILSVIIITISILNPIVSIIILLVGIIDMLFNFRKIKN